ncbi:polysaccharide deacetylase family protein [Alteribacter populi]|uniref:polysaccharide deacetylase family protein n=1 Tax=Alteribacter populi TaxID=2011011 RepID=UPI001E4EDE1B|nr:polysaccharide deacetylase family protein [Alteribacter populi]
MKVNRSILFIVLVFLVSFQALGVMSVHANDNSSGDVQQEWWWKKDKDTPEQPDKELPPLKGGPEREVRQLDPVPDVTLQQEYPDTVFLKGPTTENKIALTFDDGPDPRFTPGVLDVLSEYNVPATFFLMGARAEANPDLAQRIVEEGHVVGNHTFWHPDLVEEADVDLLVEEVTRTEDVLAEVLGLRTTLFRAPYGFLYRELVEELEILNYSVIGWSVDSLDWQEITPEEIAENVLTQIQPGSIVLMHDGAEPEFDRTQTIESLHEIIPTLQEQGYEFVTVSELLNIPDQR